MDVDVLNNLETQTKSSEYSKLDIDEFFDEMDMTTEQKEERKRAAHDFEDVVLFVFAIILAQQEYGYVDYASVKNTFVNEYTNSIGSYLAVDSVLEGYANNYADDTLETTQRHLALELAGIMNPNEIIRVLNDSYYLSEARAVKMAVNMSLDIVNYKDFLTAIQRGFRHKKWIAVRDKHTRKTHDFADGQVVPIGEFFKVGKARLMFPHDTIVGNGAECLEEIENCRCSYRYIR